MSKLDLLTDKELFLFDMILKASKDKGIDGLSTEVKKEIKRRIKEANKSMNVWLDIKKMLDYGLFEPVEIGVLIENGINNMRDLVEVDLESLKMNGNSIPMYIKESLRFKRQMYDFSCYDKKNKNKVKKIGAK